MHEGPVREGDLYTCMQCRKVYRRGGHNIKCAVLHSPGDCCHYTDTLVEPQTDRINGETYMNDLGNRIWNTAEEKGFHEPVDSKVLDKALRLLLIVSEVAEMLEEMRTGTPEKEAEELADVVIRCFHYAACEGIDLDAEVAAKMAKNELRPRKHGKRF